MGFIQHLPCPKCGSKDNLGEYTDHYYCFGCGYAKRKNDLQSIRQRLADNEPAQTGDQSLTLTSDVPKEPMQWLLSYGFNSSDVSEYSWGWCDSKKLLVLVNTPTYYQGRCFGNQSVKYLSKGDKPLLFYGHSDTIVCVEDVLSAAKINKANKDVCTHPLLGSSISPELEQTLLERFKKVILWLDKDKASQSVLMTRRLRSKGMNSETIITDKDPKELSTGEINEWLRNKL